MNGYKFVGEMKKSVYDYDHDMESDKNFDFLGFLDDFRICFQNNTDNYFLKLAKIYRGGIPIIYRNIYSGKWLFDIIFSQIDFNKPELSENCLVCIDYIIIFNNDPILHIENELLCCFSYHFHSVLNYHGFSYFNCMILILNISKNLVLKNQNNILLLKECGFYDQCFVELSSFITDSLVFDDHYNYKVQSKILDFFHTLTCSYPGDTDHIHTDLVRVLILSIKKRIQCITSDAILFLQDIYFRYPLMFNEILKLDPFTSLIESLGIWDDEYEEDSDTFPITLTVFSVLSNIINHQSYINEREKYQEHINYCKTLSYRIDPCEVFNYIWERLSFINEGEQSINDAIVLLTQKVICEEDPLSDVSVESLKKVFRICIEDGTFRTKSCCCSLMFATLQYASEYIYTEFFRDSIVSELLLEVYDIENEFVELIYKVIKDLVFCKGLYYIKSENYMIFIKESIPNYLSENSVVFDHNNWEISTIMQEIESFL